MHKAVELHKQGQLPEAEKLYRKVLKVVPNNFDALRYLGASVLTRGQFEEASRIFRKALVIRPNDPDVLNEYGDALLHLKQPEEALAAFQKAAAVAPHSLVTQNNLGNALTVLGRSEEAVACFQRAVEARPDLAEVYNNLGQALVGLGRWEDAINNFERAIEIKPDLTIAYSNLGGVFKRTGRHDDAVSCFHRALKIKPDWVEIHVQLGLSLKQLGRVDEAIAHYLRALDIEPDYDEAYTHLGVALAAQGEPERAAASYRKALQINPRATQNYRLLIALNRIHEYDDDISWMECAYADDTIDDDEKMHLAFALGRAFEDKGQYDKAFEFLLSGNSLCRSSFKYSIDNDRKLFSRLKEVFNESFILNYSKISPSDVRPIFVVGMPRSGTTLVEQILASHPSVFGAGELNFLNILIQEHFGYLRDENFPYNVPDLHVDVMRQMAGEYVSAIRNRAPLSAIITDKAPLNFMWLGFIKLALPNAKVVHCVRNPIDNCMSIFKQLFSDKGQNYAYDLTELGQFHNIYRDLMVHWHNVLPGFVLDVRYEDMVDDQEQQTRRLLEHCDLAWDDACLAFHENRRVVNTASEFQVRRPIYRSAIQSWKKYEKQLSPLISILEDKRS